MGNSNDSNEGWKAFWFMTAIGFCLWIIIGGIARCAGIKFRDSSSSPWEPRHTKIYVPPLNDVNNCKIIEYSA